MQRKVGKPANLADLAALEQTLVAFKDCYNATASPGNWCYTKAGLNASLERLATHEPHQS